MLRYYLLPLVFLQLAYSRNGVSLKSEKIWSSGCTNDSCFCGRSWHYAVFCSEHDDILKIHNCYCIFYDQLSNMSLLGTCMSSCFSQLSSERPNTLYYSVEWLTVDDAKTFNAKVCNSTTQIDIHREGRFCGRCQENYGLAVYSYHFIQCIYCADYSFKNWIKYFTVALLPLTAFTFFVILLKVNIFSSQLNGTIFMMQCLTLPTFMRIYDGMLHTQLTLKYEVISVKLFYAIFGIVNLDFLRDIYNPFCLHPKLNILFVISLDYIVALYPVTYILIKMYDRNYFIIVQAWRPFKWCLKHYNREWNVEASLVQTFGSLILLSSVKILGVMFDMLTGTLAYSTNGTYHIFLYYDATIDYLSGQHLLYAIPSLCISFVFVFLPFLLLLLYPCRCFQRILNCLGLRCQTLHIFMDAFQGSYKLEPYDMRFFSAYYLLIRFLLLLSSNFIQSMFAFPAAAFLMLISAVIFAIFRPYKNNFHNMLDVISMMLLALFYVSFTASLFSNSLDRHWGKVGFGFIAIVIIIIVFYLLTNLFFQTVHQVLQKIRAFIWKFKNRENTSSIGKICSGTDERELLISS